MIAFGIAVAIVGVLAWFSKGAMERKLAACLVLSWAACNVIVTARGFHGAPVWFAMVDAIGATYVGSLMRSPTWPAFAVFGVYVFMGAVHVAVLAPGGVGTSWAYFATLNILFALQLLFVGASSGLAIVNRLRGAFLRDHPPLVQTFREGQ